MVPDHAVPEGIAECERVKAELMRRLLNGRAAEATPVTGDVYLTASDVGARLGVDKKWVYRHQRELGALQFSDRCLRFPASRIDEFIATRR